MPHVRLKLGVEVHRTPAVVRIESLFDVPEAKRQTVDFNFDVPIEKRDWSIGLIHGPSGAGKSVVARHLFEDSIIEGYEWDTKKSIVDCFDCDFNAAIRALSSVGFSSPPSWLKPFRVLSNGEQFRATLARAICDSRKLVVIDEFTSVVDRQVAKVGSFAVAKAIRAAKGKRFVAISCHDDIVDWLDPDWTLQPHLGEFHWRLQRRSRPEVKLSIVRAKHDAWRAFYRHHYLSAELARSARCFMGLVNGEPAAFAAVLHFPHAKVKNLCSLSRIVVLPDYQGLSLGSRHFIEAIARIAAANGRVMLAHPAHPALVRVLARSKLWEMTSKPSFSPKRGKSSVMKRSISTTMGRRKIARFKWRGGSFDSESMNREARLLWFGARQ